MNLEQRRHNELLAAVREFAAQVSDLNFYFELDIADKTGKRVMRLAPEPAEEAQSDAA